MAEKINTTQPKSYQWMAKPENRGDVPAGLEYIDSLTSIHLKQKILGNIPRDFCQNFWSRHMHDKIHL